MDFTTFCDGITVSDDLDYSTATNNQMICANHAAITGTSTGLDVFYLLFAAGLVFLMQAGFAMLCAGSVRQKNVKNILLKNLLDACCGAIGFWAIGWGLAYGGGDKEVKRFVGNTGFFLSGFESGGDYIGWFFQFAFAATAATIVAGTVAERCKMQAYLFYAPFLTGFVYPVIVHSIWCSSGFLSAFNGTPFLGVGVIDFAGSGVVHMTGGCTALIAAIVLGPRQGRFHDIDGNVLDEPTVFPPHSVALQMLGTFLLWFGWYGFNPGSTLAIANSVSADVAALCAVTTTIAAGCGCITACFTDSIIGRMQTGETEYDLSMAMNGTLGALVGITAGCSVVEPWAAAVIGIIAGWVYLFASKLLIKLRIDDAVDAIPVHFFNGMWGLIAVGLFADPDRVAAAYSEDASAFPGLFMGGGTLLGVQIVAILWICAWVIGIMAPFFLTLRYLNMFRVDALEEEVGLDISHHKGPAYDLTEANKEHVEQLVAHRSEHGGQVEGPSSS